MKLSTEDHLKPESLVGDPVDVISGANLDITFEFQLPGPLPLVWWRHYDSSKANQKYALGWGHTHSFDRRLQFDVDGLRYTGPVGRVTAFPPLYRDGYEHASNGLIIRRITSQIYHIFDDLGPMMEFQFRSSESSTPIKALRKDNHSIVFHWNDAARLTGITDSLHRYIRVESNDDSRILALILTKSDDESERALMRFRYDEKGNFVDGIDAYGHTFRFTYDQQNRLVSRKDRRGYSFFYEYDKEGWCVSSRGEDGLHEVKLRYLPLERVTIVTRADGGQWTYFYSEGSVITKIIDPYGGTRNFKLDSLGRVVEETDSNGVVTQWVYGRGRGLVGKRSSLGYFSSDPDGPPRPDQCAHRIPTRPVQWEYGDLLPVERIAIPHPHDPILFQFPSHTRRLLRTEPPDSQQLFSGRETPEHRHYEGHTYDDFGRLIAENGQNGVQRRWDYDVNGYARTFHDYDGSTYRYEYTSWNLRCREEDPLGNAISYTYTPTEKTASVTDAGGMKSEYSYDLKDRLVEVRRHGVVKEKYRYDEADNLIEKLDGDEKPLLTFEIGPGNLKTIRHLASGENHYFLYDQRGRYTEVATDESKVQFDYDSFGNRTRDERNGLGVKHEFDGVRGLIKTTLFDRFTITYRRTADGVFQITDPGGRNHSIRSPGSGIVVREMSNGSTERIQFGPDGRCLLKELTRANLATPQRVLSHTYSGEGDLLKVEDSGDGTTRYEYDAAHRLKYVFRQNGDRDEFHYDAAGNLFQQPGLTGVSLRDGNRLYSANGDEFEYDDRNHIATRVGRNGTTRYHYDSRDMLVRSETPKGSWEASYDPLGRRTRKSFGGRSVEFYWDTDRLSAEIHDDLRLRIYIYSDAFAMVPLLFIEYDSIDADPATGKRYFVFTNHISAPIRVEDESGRVVWRARLDAYGSAHISNSSTIEMPLRFPGHYFDVETGLHYNRFRYYSPELGRYVQSDPLGVAGGTNLYSYTSNPLKYVDVRGDNCPGGPDEPHEDEGGSTQGGADKENDEGKPTTPSDEEPDPRAAMRQLADDARQNNPDPDERPNTVARLENEDGSIITGQSRKGDAPEPHQAVQAALDQVPPNQQSDHHGKCAEIDAMSNNAHAADAAGKDPAKANEGALIQTAQVRGEGGDQSRHGAPQTPCRSCQSVMTQLGAAYNPR